MSNLGRYEQECLWAEAIFTREFYGSYIFCSVPVLMCWKLSSGGVNGMTWWHWEQTFMLLVCHNEIGFYICCAQCLTAESVWIYEKWVHKTIRMVDCIWNVMAHMQKPDFVFWRNGQVHLNRQGRQFSRLLAAEVCTSAVVMLDTPCSEVVWRVMATHSIRQFPLHFPSRASPCAITFRLDSIKYVRKYIHAYIKLWKMYFFLMCTYVIWICAYFKAPPLLSATCCGGEGCEFQ
jgi:hypothetical protein